MARLITTPDVPRCLRQETWAEATRSDASRNGARRRVIGIDGSLMVSGRKLMRPLLRANHEDVISIFAPLIRAETACVCGFCSVRLGSRGHTLRVRVAVPGLLKRAP